MVCVRVCVRLRVDNTGESLPAAFHRIVAASLLRSQRSKSLCFGWKQRSSSAVVRPVALRQVPVLVRVGLATSVKD